VPTRYGCVCVCVRVCVRVVVVVVVVVGGVSSVGMQQVESHQKLKQTTARG
jgi:hypothetical protein